MKSCIRIALADRQDNVSKKESNLYRSISPLCSYVASLGPTPAPPRGYGTCRVDVDVLSLPEYNIEYIHYHVPGRPCCGVVSCKKRPGYVVYDCRVAYIHVL